MNYMNFVKHISWYPLTTHMIECCVYIYEIINWIKLIEILYNTPQSTVFEYYLQVQMTLSL